MNLIAQTTHMEKKLAKPEQGQRGEAYLSFQLTDCFSAAFSMSDVHEVAVVSLGQITPMFNLPPYLLGLLARRSRILWTVDLSQWLCDESMTAAASSNQLSVAVVRVNPTQVSEAALPLEDRALLGLVVQRVNGYIQLCPESIQPPDQAALQDKLSTNLRRCWYGSVWKEPDRSESDGESVSAGKHIHILDANAIATYLPKDFPDSRPQ